MSKTKLYAFLFLFSFTCGNVIAADDDDVLVGGSENNDTSPPLRDMFDKTQGTFHLKNKNLIAREINAQLAKSSLVPLSAFQGIGTGLGSYQVTELKPDTNLGVGLTQIVQFANPDIAIFDKATGQVEPGFPKKGNVIWQGFTGPCENFASGRMTLKYEKLANRWVISQYANGNMNTGPFYHCIAVSTTSDAGGSYYRYAFQLDSASDYVRLGVWPDGYYTGFNMIGRISFGPLICAFDRSKMLVGQPATSICKQLSTQESSNLLPVNLNSHITPPAGYPAYFLGLGGPNNINSLVLYKFHADFNVPSKSTIKKLVIPVEPFSQACNSTSGLECAVQPGTNMRLDVITNRLKARMPYRQFANYGSMVATHVIEGPQPKFAPSIRWYELRVMNGTPDFNPIIAQQGTIAPDSKNRYAPSMNINQFGDLVIGYTVSSSAVHPSPEMAYHRADQPRNMMTIQPLFTGLGSQTGSGAWGDTSKMVVDPSDDCTFWYTSEYLKQNSLSKDWSTVLLKFKLETCV